MKQNLKKWLILILVFSYVITRRKTIQLDEPQRNDEVSILEEEREQNTLDGNIDQRGTETEEQGDKENNVREVSRAETYPETEVTSYIKEVFGEDADMALHLALCESTLGLDPVSLSGRYVGLFQFDEPTWHEQCVGDINNYRDQTDCTKKLIDRGELERRWPTCGR